MLRHVRWNKCGYVRGWTMMFVVCTVNYLSAPHALVGICDWSRHFIFSLHRDLRINSGSQMTHARHDDIGTYFCAVDVTRFWVDGVVDLQINPHNYLTHGCGPCSIVRLPLWWLWITMRIDLKSSIYPIPSLIFGSNRRKIGKVSQAWVRWDELKFEKQLKAVNYVMCVPRTRTTPAHRAYLFIWLSRRPMRYAKPRDHRNKSRIAPIKLNLVSVTNGLAKQTSWYCATRHCENYIYPVTSESILSYELAAWRLESSPRLFS